MPPHRDEVLHATPTHGFPEGGPQWEVAVLPLGSDEGNAPEDALYHFEQFQIRVPSSNPRTAKLLLQPDAPKKSLDLAFATALHLILRREGRLDVHAASVAPRPGVSGLLILGPKGSGKSSLTLALARAGWNFNTDDHALAWKDGDEIRLGSLRASLFFTPDAVSRLPAPAPKGRIIEFMGKRQFEPEQVLPGQYQPEGRLGAIVFPERIPEGPSAIVPMRAVDAFQRLLMLCPFLTSDASARPCIEVARRIADLPAFVLRSGPDILEPATAARVLEAALA